MAVMLATTSGSVVPIPVGAGQVDIQPELTDERRGTMNTSEYVRSWAGGALRNRMGTILASSIQKNPLVTSD
jgi:hypothetical protein